MTPDQSAVSAPTDKIIEQLEKELGHKVEVAGLDDGTIVFRKTPSVGPTELIPEGLVAKAISSVATQSKLSTLEEKQRMADSHRAWYALQDAKKVREARARENAANRGRKKKERSKTQRAAQKKARKRNRR